MLNERSNMQKLVRRLDLARTCKNWCAAWSTSGAGALATAPVPHDDDQGSQVVRVNVVAVSQSQGRGGEFSLQLFFFVFVPTWWHVHITMGRKRKKHRTHVEEESLVRGRFNWRGVRPGRCTMHARHFMRLHFTPALRSR